MEILLGMLCVALVIATLMLYTNRFELLEIIKKEVALREERSQELGELKGKLWLVSTTAKENENKLKELQEQFDKEKLRNDTVISQKKSSETKIGQISEQLAPFLENFKHNPKETRFLGSPIDMIAFDFDNASITFLEIKTGNAQESKRQRIIKNAIKMGRVYYEQLRINEKGIKVKQEINNE